MKTCCVCGFREKRDIIDGNDRVSYHSFPKKKDMCRAWITAIGQKGFKLTKSSILCSQHFSKECLYYPNNGGGKQRIRLKPDSVPTLFNTYYWKRKNRNSGMQSIKQNQHDFSMIKIEEQDIKVNVKTDSTKSDANTKSALHVNSTATCSTLNECQVKSENTNRRNYVTSKGTQCGQVYPRSICFGTPSHFWSREKVIHSWKMARNRIISQRRQIQQLRKNNYCLRTKVAILEMLLSDM